jgi:hypothetical protein
MKRAPRGTGRERPVGFKAIKTPIMVSVSIEEEEMWGGRGRGGTGRFRLGGNSNGRGPGSGWLGSQAARPGKKKGPPDGWAPRVSEREREGGGRQLMGLGGPVSARVRVSKIFFSFSFLFKNINKYKYF